MKRFLLTAVLILVQTAAFAQDVKEKSELKKRIEEEISFIDNQLKSLAGRQKATTEQLTLIRKKVANRQTLIRNIDIEIAGLNHDMTEKQRQINRLNSELDTLSTYYSNLIYNTYKNRNTKVWFLYVLSSENIGQGYRRLAYLKNLSSEVNGQGEKIKEKKAEIEAEKEELAKLKAAALKIKAERESEYKKLQKEEADSKSTIKKLSASEKQYRADLAKKRKEVERLNKEIQKLLSKTVAGQKKDNTKIDYALSGKFEQNKGKLPWPLKQGVITEHFGVHNHPVYKNLKLPENNGVTFSTSKNAEVFCVFDGEVRQVVVMPGYNQCVLVQHGTYFTFYCKLQKVSVKSGQKVTRGQSLGTLEASDGASQLHFQIWNGTQKQNPENWLRK